MLEQAIDELMAFVKRRGGRLIFGDTGTVFTEGDAKWFGGKTELLLAMREDSERESRKRERYCHRFLLSTIVKMRGDDQVPHCIELARCIDASERCLKEAEDAGDDS